MDMGEKKHSFSLRTLPPGHIFFIIGGLAVFAM
jgi:hypothetical protein